MDARRDGLTAREFSSVEHIAVHRAGQPPRQSFQVLDHIQGLSCNLSPAPSNHPAHKVVTEYEALYDMKLEAADLRANAVVGVSCRSRGLSRNCYQSIVCEGDAVRLDDGVGMELPPVSMQALRAPSGDTEPSVDAALYRSLLGFTPDYLTEAERAGLGNAGVATPDRTPGSTVNAPPGGEIAAYQGAGLMFVQCAAQGGTIGLIVSPLCAAIGAGIGAFSAESEDNVRTSGFAIRTTLGEYYSHSALRDRVVRIAAQSGARPLILEAPVDHEASTGRDDIWHFDEPVDCVIEVGVEELLLPQGRGGAATNLPVPVSVRARARVICPGDSGEIYNRSYGFVSEKRLFREWGAQGGAALRHALETGFDELAERMVEDLLLAYPLMPGFAVSGAPSGRRYYVVEPIAPPAHPDRDANNAAAARATSLEPRLRWRAFPSRRVLAADFQGKLGSLTRLRYDVRLYRVDGNPRKARLVLEKNRLDATDYQIEQPLAPDTEYAWSVRARFVLDTGERVSRWSGDRIAGNVRGFLFRTPG